MTSAAEVAPGVRRLTAPNPGPMTATGTQTYLVGRGRAAVIDPGPAIAAHREAILRALADARPVAILVTHSHRDHSAGAGELARATGAPVLAFGPHGAGMRPAMRALAAEGLAGGGEGADPSFAPDRTLAEGAEIATDAGTLRALHTPGHLSNHLAFALEAGPAAGTLFTGDTVMGWSSTLVSPPEGDMTAFMETLARLKARDDRLYLPGHGPEVTDPAALLARQIAHREARARAVCAALAEGPASATVLTPMIYRDTPASLHPAATRNLFATLLWLADLGRVAPAGPAGPETPYALTR